jgi:hypothetical protein
MFSGLVQKVITERIISVFLLVLIITGNYLGELFPCRVQSILSNSIILKHIGGYFTLLFFVVLTLPGYQDLSKTEITDFFLSSLFLYGWFVLMSKNYHTIWFITFGLSALMYLIYLYETKLDNDDEEDEDKDDNNKANLDAKKYEDGGNVVDILKQTISYLIIVSTLGGMFVYMGAKKFEYGKDFNYLSFFLNKPSCRNVSPKFQGYLTCFLKGITP